VDNNGGGKLNEETGSAKQKKWIFMKITVFKHIRNSGITGDILRVSRIVCLRGY
jgi:hypothetical protein